MPNIPPNVAYFPKVPVDYAESIFATLQGEDSAGANITTLTGSGGISASPTSGAVLLTNTGIQRVVGAGGIGAPYNETTEEVEISYPAVNNVAGALRTFVPLAFGTGGNVVSSINQGTDENLFTITMPVSSTYCKLTLFFQAGTLSADPLLYSDNVGGSTAPFVIYLSYLASTGTPPTNIDFFYRPNGYVFTNVDVGVQDPVTSQWSGGTFCPNITLEMTSPDPTNIWYVNMAHLGAVDPNVRVVWNYQTIAPSISTARLENVVSENVITPD